MKRFHKVLTASVIAVGLTAGGGVAAAPATAMTTFGLRTFACGAGKTAQIDWKSTGNVRLFKWNTNAPYASDTLVREVTKNGSYSYNSGVSTLHWTFGTAPGNVTSWTERCVAFNR